MGSRLSFIIPLVPPPQLRPNWKGHWGTRAEFVRKWRRDSCLITQSAHIDAGRPDFDPQKAILVIYAIYWPKGAKKLDQDNAVASMKSYTDGISDALTRGYDGKYTTLVTQDRDRTGGGFVEVVVTQEE